MADGELVPLGNASDHPCERFAVPLRQWRSILDRAELVLHSHPNGEPCPSVHDQRQQIATGLPWYVKPSGLPGFYFGDGAPRIALTGRPYRFGATDCYSVVRDGLRELYGIRIGNHVREWGFAKRGEPLFERSLAAEGFREISERLADARPGDGVLFLHRRTRTAFHCALVLEEGLILHHPSPGIPYDPTTVSTAVPAARYGQIPLRVVRHA